MLNNFGELISKKRREMNLTQQQLGDQLFVTRQTVSRWEQGHTYPNLDTLVKLSQQLNFSLDYALTGDEIMVEKIACEQKNGVRRKWMLRGLLILFIIISIFSANYIFKLDHRLVQEKEIESVSYNTQSGDIKIQLETGIFTNYLMSELDIDENTGVITLNIIQKFNLFNLFKNDRNNTISYNLKDYPNNNLLKIENTSLEIELK